MIHSRFFKALSLFLALLVGGAALSACGTVPSPAGETGTGPAPADTDAGTGPSETEPAETEPDLPDLKAVLSGCNVLVLPSYAGAYLTKAAEDFIKTVKTDLGIDLAIKNRPSSGDCAVYFGNGAKVSRDLYADLQNAQYRFAEKNGHLLIALGSDVAAQTVNANISRLLAGKTPLPYTSAQAAKDPVVLRVGTYNIHNGQDVGHNFSTIGAALSAMDLDIVGLQEVDKNVDRSKNQDSLKLIAESAGYDYYYYTACIPLGAGEYGTGILSRYPILESESVMMPGEGEQRGYGHVKLDVNGTEIDFYNTHLAWPSATARAQQIQVLSQDVQEGERIILTGDMNCTIEDLDKPFEDYNYVNGFPDDDNHFITNSEDGAIDNILFSFDYSLLDCGMVESGNSDHNMLWALLLLK